MTPRVLWVSQIAPREVCMARDLPDERLTAHVSLPGASVTVVDATEEAPPDPRSFHAVLVGGSVGCVFDDEPWRVRLLDWLATIGDQPFFGICGGHQAFAQVRGGRVQRGGARQAGLHPLALEGFGAGLVMHNHDDAVVLLPPDATLWAHDAVGVQALRYGRAQWSTQFHAEADAVEGQKLWRSAGIVHTEADIAAAAAFGARILAAWLRDVAKSVGGVEA